MKQYKTIIKTVTKNVNIPILQNVLCNDSGMTASDGNIFLYIKDDMFDDTTIRNVEGVIQDMNVEDFIANPEYGVYQNSLLLDTKTLIDAIKQLKSYIAKGSEAREYLKGIHIQSNNNTIITATDGYKASQVIIDNAFSMGSNDLNVYIPEKLMRVIECLDKIGAVDVKIEQYDKVTVIETANISIIYKPNDYFNSDLKRVFNVLETETITKIHLDKHITLSTLKALKSEIISYIDADTETIPSKRKWKKDNIVLTWTDNMIKYVYEAIHKTIPFTRIIPVEGTIEGNIHINDFILMLNSIESDNINIDLIRNMENPYNKGYIQITENNKKYVFLLKK
jgi:hypothetical protein